MKVFYDTIQKHHVLTHEIISGRRFRHHERRSRIDVIIKRLRSHLQFEITTPERVPVDLLVAVHDDDYLAFLEKSQEWAETEIIWPYVFPCDHRIPRHGPVGPLTAGHYCFDVGTPIMRDTWRSAIAAASGAWSAARHMRRTGETTYALARPPGHHATQSMFGGYCYLNNSAIAANYLSRHGRVLIIDFDFHHGNGTQSIFYDRSDVFYLSVHADPAKEYPYFTGFEFELGMDDGVGFNRNVPLDPFSSPEIYFAALQRGIEAAFKAGVPDYIVVSAGFDIAKDDPLGHFGFSVEDFHALGTLIRNLKKPTVLIQEGGYLVENLGRNVESFLTAFL